jgi:predicted acyltransferase (DUF342 family)
MITINEILESDKLSASRITINDNFRVLADAINTLQKKTDDISTDNLKCITLESEGDIVAGGNLSVQNSLTLQGDLTARGSINVSGNASITEDITCRSLTTEQDINIGRNAHFAGDATVNGTIDANELRTATLDISDSTDFKRGKLITVNGGMIVPAESIAFSESTAYAFCILLNFVLCALSRGDQGSAQMYYNQIMAWLGLPAQPITQASDIYNEYLMQGLKNIIDNTQFRLVPDLFPNL